MNKTFRYRCTVHNVDLQPDGHGAGMGTESWPGISAFYTKDGIYWELDTEELVCPQDDWEDDDMTCSDDWEIVPSTREELFAAIQKGDAG